MPSTEIPAPTAPWTATTAAEHYATFTPARLANTEATLRQDRAGLIPARDPQRTQQERSARAMRALVAALPDDTEF
jgi:hypothetical protein